MSEKKMQNWENYRKDISARIGELASASPETMKAFGALGDAAGKTDHLGAKVRELISLAVAVTTRCDGCIAFHSVAAKNAGATREELAEALSVAMAMNAGAALIYTARTLDAFANA
jgi:AhpD family alkylhydroperoxidase